MMDEALKGLFAEFERAIGALDFEKIGELYTDSFIAAGPDGVITRSKAEFLAGAHKASEFYKSIGQTSLKIVSMEETKISDHYSLVTVRWGATFHKTGDTLVEFDDSYVVQTVQPKTLIPVHTQHPEVFENLHDHVIIPEKGVKYTV